MSKRITLDNGWKISFVSNNPVLSEDIIKRFVVSNSLVRRPLDSVRRSARLDKGVINQDICNE